MLLINWSKDPWVLSCPFSRLKIISQSLTVFKRCAIKIIVIFFLSLLTASITAFSVKLSNEMPFLYGAFAIITAISLGILAAYLRKILSDLRKKKLKEEVKFPVK